MSLALTFAKLAEDFKLEENAQAALLAADWQNLEEFRLFFSTEEGVMKFLDNVKDVENKQLQTARVRSA